MTYRHLSAKGTDGPNKGTDKTDIRKTDAHVGKTDKVRDTNTDQEKPECSSSNDWMCHQNHPIAVNQ